MSRTSFVSRLRDQVIRPLVHSALTEDEIPEITLAVVVGTEFDSSFREPWELRWTYPEDGDEYVWAHVTYRPTNEGGTWRLGRSEDLHDPSVLIDALQQLGWDVEDWVCETTFGWGEERHARRVQLGDLPEWLIAGS
ncbi:hypothetical protein ACIRON_23780 [Nocardioides sp. NPDC101246]|uniref:hypothetical protein n=1 Tax=Nocardioides sp. NPDC101246 TaxID=3364336 RepID=UPI003800DC4D